MLLNAALASHHRLSEPRTGCFGAERSNIAHFFCQAGEVPKALGFSRVGNANTETRGCVFPSPANSLAAVGASTAAKQVGNASFLYQLLKCGRCRGNWPRLWLLPASPLMLLLLLLEAKRPHADMHEGGWTHPSRAAARGQGWPLWDGDLDRNLPRHCCHPRKPWTSPFCCLWLLKTAITSRITTTTASPGLIAPGRSN